LTENVLKRISANSNPNLNPNSNPKAQKRFREKNDVIFRASVQISEKYSDVAGLFESIIRVL